MTHPILPDPDSHDPKSPESAAELNGQPAYLVDETECARFQSQMPERISSGEDLQAHPHMLTCERCRALVRDLEYIAEAARQLLPVEAEPPDEIWIQIQLAIERGEA
jgi:hypothetical protein